MSDNKCNQDNNEGEFPGTLGGCLAPPGSACCYNLAAMCSTNKILILVSLVFAFLACSLEILKLYAAFPVPISAPGGLAFVSALGFCSLAVIVAYTVFASATVDQHGIRIPNEGVSCGYSSIESEQYVKVDTSLSMGFGLIVLAS